MAVYLTVEQVRELLVKFFKKGEGMQIEISITVKQLGKGYIAEDSEGQFAAGTAAQVAAAVAGRAREEVLEKLKGNLDPAHDPFLRG